ncbi:MAG TPA: tRNA lysidine(34) synthetase TilS [bacterium]|jgi:tRNA(Ile)-lysidine synthase
MFDGLSHISSFLNARTLPDDRFLVAVSGGADSQGLLALLADGARIPAARLVAGHVNHGIRTDADKDLLAIAQITEPRRIPVIAKSVDVPLEAKNQHLSLEAAARRLRYATLQEMASEMHCRWILTAHTMDDSAETVLMRMRSGAPWYEWTGIPARRGNILRPLLTVLRREVRAWVAGAGLPFHEDSTNLDLRFQRNRLRSELREHPEYWNRHQIERFSMAGRDLERVLNVWRRLVYELPIVHKPGLKAGAVGLAIDEIFRYFNNLTFLPAEVMWGHLTGQQDARLPSKLRRQITSFLCGRGPEAALPLPFGIQLVRRGRTAWLVKDLPADQVRMPVSVGLWQIPGRKATLEIGSTPPNGAAIGLRSDVLGRNLVVRNWQPGDRITPRRRPEKKIADLLAEKKMDPFERSRVLVLADEAGPLMMLSGTIVDERIAADGTQGEIVWVTWSEGE